MNAPIIIGAGIVALLFLSRRESSTPSTPPSGAVAIGEDGAQVEVAPDGSWRWFNRETNEWEPIPEGWWTR